jgi:hypothetical protein
LIDWCPAFQGQEGSVDVVEHEVVLVMVVLLLCVLPTILPEFTTVMRFWGLFDLKCLTTVTVKGLRFPIKGQATPTSGRLGNDKS